MNRSQFPMSCKYKHSTTHLQTFKIRRCNRWMATCWLVCVAVLIGCVGRVAPVDVSKATSALELSLESWKEGKKPDELLEESPPITVHEIEWSNGAKLLDYEIVSDEKNADQSLIAWVKLKRKTVNGKVSETTAKYIVNTSPELTVLRMMTRK
jgi:hypothetical protein